MKKGKILILISINLIVSCTTMAKQIGYIEPGEVKSRVGRQEFNYCSLKYPGLIDGAINNFKNESKKDKIQNVSISYYSNYIIFNCVKMEYE
ncbi:hypothetical protein ACO2KH_01890 [Leptospira terpstrae]|uniref:hypothetical protein n=1 Tax=Leptospira terpstrae TaxID=293075 RepID=UPI003D078A86